MVTAETALVFPVVAFLLALVLGVFRYGVDQVRCVDAARAGARAAARGDTPAAVRSVALRGAPTGAEVVISAAAGTIVVRVQAPVPPPMRLLGTVPPPLAEAIAPSEHTHEAAP